MEAKGTETATLQRKRYPGTYRGRPPSETLALIRPHLATAGITRVAVVTGLDGLGIPVVMVCRPGGRSLSVTQGKGVTLEAAKVSGIMEALEHFCAEMVSGPLHYASARELAARGLNAVDCTGLDQTTRSWTYDTPLLWIAARSLTADEESWVPYDLVHLDHRTPLPASGGYFLMSSNGLASGNCLSEATCHALLELIERHETQNFYALSSRAQAARQLDLTSVQDETCSVLIERLRAARVHLTVFDLTCELGVPCYLCDILDVSRDAFRVLPRARGVGCHSDRAVALARALCEAAQSRLTMIAGARDDISHAELQRARVQAALANRAGSAPVSNQVALAFRSQSGPSFASFEQESRYLSERIVSAGHAAPLRVDLSNQQLPIAVVRVIAPGLRAHHTQSDKDAGAAS